MSTVEAASVPALAPAPPAPFRKRRSADAAVINDVGRRTGAAAVRSIRSTVRDDGGDDHDADDNNDGGSGNGPRNAHKNDNNDTETETTNKYNLIGLGRMVSIAVYLVSWVANGEWMQSISTGAGDAYDDGSGNDVIVVGGEIDNNIGSGSLTDASVSAAAAAAGKNVTDDGSPPTAGATVVAYNKPAFLTWYAYCHLVLAWVPVIVYVSIVNERRRRRRRQQRQRRRRGNDDLWEERTGSLSSSILSQTINFATTIRTLPSNLHLYVMTVWSKNSVDFWSSCWKCLTFNYILIGLNVLWVVGLTQNISVATSNAIYQSQIPATVLLSMYHDDRRSRLRLRQRQSGKKHQQQQDQQRRRRHRHEQEQKWRRVLQGTIISCVGIGMIVIPPLLVNKSRLDDSGALSAPEAALETSTRSSSPILGILVTFLSAMISAVYQVAWKVLMDEKDENYVDRGVHNENNDREDTQVDEHGDTHNGTMKSIDKDVIDEETGQEFQDDNHYQQQQPGRSTINNAPYYHDTSSENSISNVKERGLINTFVTLGVMGVCNILFGWPVLLLLHWLGIERIDLEPIPQMWKLLTMNSLIEALFDTSCAVAIYMTSPVITSITAPLTIPISVAWDIYFRTVRHSSHNESITTTVGASTSITDEDATNNVWLILVGSILIVVGVVRIEMTAPSSSSQPHRH